MALSGTENVDLLLQVKCKQNELCLYFTTGEVKASELV